MLAELHIYGFGEHGAGLGTGDLDFREWPVLLVNWLRRCGLLTGNSRQAVMGKATLDGEPMGWAWVSFLPIDNNAPPARARTSRGEEGRFSIPASHGVVLGPHRVEVHHISEQFPPTNTGVYTLDDAVCYDIGVLEIADEPVVIDVDSDAAAR